MYSGFPPAPHHPLRLYSWHCGVLQLPGPHHHTRAWPGAEHQLSHHRSSTEDAPPAAAKYNDGPKPHTRRTGMNQKPSHPMWYINTRLLTVTSVHSKCSLYFRLSALLLYMILMLITFMFLDSFCMYYFLIFSVYCFFKIFSLAFVWLYW